MLARALPRDAKLAAGLGMRVIEREVVRRAVVLFTELVEEILTADIQVNGGIDAVIGILIFHELLAHGMPPIGDTGPPLTRCSLAGAPAAY